MARVTLSQAGEDVTVGGSDIQLVGTTAGDEIITVTGGNVRLDASFNRGGDTIRLPGLASEYTAYRSFSEVIFTRAGGSVTLRIPIGTAGTEIAFDGGDSRTLLINTTTGQANLEGQELSSSSSSQTALTPSNPSGSTGYDVVNGTFSVFEGDAGSTLLVYTITLDRPVAAADGPLTINYQTRDGTTGIGATAGSDYAAAAGSVVIAVGQQSASVTVSVLGDTVPEPTETIDLVLTGSGLRNSPEVLVGNIQANDGFAAALNTGDVPVSESSNRSAAASAGPSVDATAVNDDALSPSHVASANNGLQPDGGDLQVLLQNISGMSASDVEAPSAPEVVFTSADDAAVFQPFDVPIFA